MPVYNHPHHKLQSNNNFRVRSNSSGSSRHRPAVYMYTRGILPVRTRPKRLPSVTMAPRHRRARSVSPLTTPVIIRRRHSLDLSPDFDYQSEPTRRLLFPRGLIHFVADMVHEHAHTHARSRSHARKRLKLFALIF